MMIIVTQILVNDVAPFACFAFVAVGCFECSSYMFFWTLDLEFAPVAASDHTLSDEHHRHHHGIAAYSPD